MLSSLLNQNPDINVSANSFVADIFNQGESLIQTDLFQNFPDINSLESYLSSVFDSYYQNWRGTYIIDRGPWGTPHNLNLLKRFLKNKIKILVPVRDIVEIIASFVRLNPKCLASQFDYEVRNGLRFPASYKSELEIKCELITSPYGQLEKNLFALLNLKRHENQEFLHIIEYKNLILNPKKTIEAVYDFLEIPHHEHNYEFISDFQVNNCTYRDEVLHGCSLHEVKEKIQTPSYRVEDVLTPALIQKYSGREFWRN